MVSGAMKGSAITKNNERGTALVELAIGAAVFFTVIFAVLEFSRLLWTHNALADAARQGARYAAINCSSSIAQVKNVVVYGVPSPANGAKPVIYGMTTGKVTV